MQLRQLRAEEQAAWERATGLKMELETAQTQEPAPCSVFQMARMACPRRWLEESLHVFMALSAAIGLWVALAGALQLHSHWPNFVALVKRVVP